MNIYLPLEVKVRELEGRGLLALAAAERGHTVVFGSKSDTIEMARSGRFPPGIVHMKSITPSDSMISLLGDLKSNGHVVTVQDEESGLLDESYDRFAGLRYSKETLSLVSRVLTWGEFDTASLKSIYSEFSDRFVITGSPRVDFWREDFEAFYRDHPAKRLVYPTAGGAPSSTTVPAESARGAEAGGTSHQPPGIKRPLILIASNFSSLLNENRYWNIMARLRQAGYFDRDTEWEFREYEYAAYQMRLIGQFVKMIRELSVAFPEAAILVRPHPVESVEGWEKLIGDYPNVVVNREGTISGWIRNALVLIHNGCTSALESAVSGIPRIAYRPLPHDFERVIPNLMSSHAFSLEELTTSVSDLIEGKSLSDNRLVSGRTDELLTPRFANLKGRLAADRILDEWEKVGRESGLEQSSVTELVECKKTDRAPFPRRMKRHLARLRNRFRSSVPAKKKDGQLLKSDHKFPDFKREEIETLESNLQSVLGRFENIDIQRFGKKSFIFYSNKQSIL